MALETKLVQKLSQSLLMTPQLQQAIKLLQLGRQEYIDAIQKELLENPVLEELKEEDGDSSQKAKQEESSNQETSDQQEAVSSQASDSDSSSSETPESDSPVSWEDYIAHFSDAKGSSTPKGMVDHEDRPSLEATLTREETLQEHIMSQLRLADIEEEDHEIALNILGNLNRDG